MNIYNNGIRIMKRGGNMQIHNVTDKCFCKYGKVINNIDFSQLLEAMKETPLASGVEYVASVKSLESLPVANEIQRVFYGEMPIQIGYCNGHNTMLNALEYHRSSEINLAVSDAVLLVGLESDITEDFTYDTSNVEAFLLPAGMAVEIYATTLHYAPCQCSDNGFRVSVILPKGTNTALETVHGGKMIGDEDALITAKNKWLIGHPDGGLPEGTFIGLTGKNLDITK